MRFIIYLFIVGVISKLSGQQDYEVGKLTDSIHVSNTTNETFALYLPTTFEDSKESPILFILNLPDGDVKEI